jgi:hypothetical protein
MIDVAQIDDQIPPIVPSTLKTSFTKSYEITLIIKIQRCDLQRWKQILYY